MIKAVLFDLDDTLYDYEYAHQISLKKVFSKLKKTTNMSIEMLKIIFEISQSEVKRQLIGTAASHNRDLYFQKFFENLNQQMRYKILPKEIIHYYELYRKYFYNAMQKEKASSQLLKYLKKNKIKTWIVTDSFLYSQLHKMENLEISNDIDVLVSSEETGAEKPHSSPFLLAMHKLGVLAKDCIMVGDNIARDIGGGKAVGMCGIWINRHQKSDQGILYDYKVETTSELFSLLKKLLKASK